MNDLKAYQREGGVYYFVVYLIVENKKVVEKQVYGKQLHQLDLQLLLQKKQKSVTIKMYEIKNKNILYSNCLKYIKEKRLQNQVDQVSLKSIIRNIGLDGAINVTINTTIYAMIVVIVDIVNQ
ncbi:hypothetical protein MUA73_00135 [Staphylococcus simulans]|uniref:hypothetical protein n=1 Tax=Staphylococcus simulans TaxID=1286 RepID=UPI0021D343E7|nr:hypothetical protein [Staphylococcus simulans]UXR30334.1 hypothetical protein MUA73_00135 [Staphylococcus simulans]